MVTHVDTTSRIRVEEEESGRFHLLRTLKFVVVGCSKIFQISIIIIHSTSSYIVIVTIIKDSTVCKTIVSIISP